MELLYLQTFREVARWGSFTKAAEQLGYAQSSVTVQIQKLEKTYGAILFERYGKRMRLTEAGEGLLPYANEITRLYKESREIVSGNQKGSITIGIIETLAAFYLPPRLQQFLAVHPTVHVSLFPGNEKTIRQSVKDGEVDIGFIIDHLIEEPEVQRIVIREEEMVIITHPEHRLRTFTQAAITDLANENLIVTEEGCSYRQLLISLLQANQVPFRLSYEFTNLETIKQSVIYGLGIALVPRFAVQKEVESKTVVAIPLIQNNTKLYTQLIYAKERWLSPTIKGFLELFENSISE